MIKKFNFEVDKYFDTSILDTYQKRNYSQHEKTVIMLKKPLYWTGIWIIHFEENILKSEDSLKILIPVIH